jgi:hypothetical protein
VAVLSGVLLPLQPAKYRFTGIRGDLMIKGGRVFVLFVAIGVLFTAAVTSNLIGDYPVSIKEDLLDWLLCGTATAVLTSVMWLRMRSYRRLALEQGWVEGDVTKPYDLTHAQTFSVAFRRLYAGLLNFVLDHGGNCRRCWVPFALTSHHITMVEGTPIFALCDGCFNVCTREERLRYYGQQYGDLLGQGMVDSQTTYWQAVVAALDDEDAEREKVRQMQKKKSGTTNEAA